MSHPAAYAPEYGYKYQILCRNQSYDRSYEHCDYAKHRYDKNHLLTNYRQAYGAGWEFKVIILPMKYWPVWEVYDNVHHVVLHSYSHYDLANRCCNRLTHEYAGVHGFQLENGRVLAAYEVREKQAA